MVRTVLKRVVPEVWRKNARALQYRIDSVLGLSHAWTAVRRYGDFRRSLHRYRALPGAEPISSRDLYPCLFDNTPTTPAPPHYFYQAAWAARRILQAPPRSHVDIGSQLDFIAVLSASLPVTFVDIRPLHAALSNVWSVAGSSLALPFRTGSISSLSCLSVIEHIGLGRYGDPLDPAGTEGAARELTRILAPGGRLFLSAPVGRERTCFNAHRVPSPFTLLRYFSGLSLVEFSCEEDGGRYREHVDPGECAGANLACGMFLFTKS